MSTTELQQTITDYLQDRLPSYLDLLQQMVAINSFTANAAGVNALGELTARAFADLGFNSDTVQSAIPHYGRHLVLTRPGRSGRKIGLVSHLDTVFPQEEEIRNDFAWREEGDKIYGPGTVDIKGGTVMVHMVLSALKMAAPDHFDDITWVILLDAAEEAEAEDFGRLCIERLAGAETLGCLIFEGGYVEEDEFQIVVMRKGMAVYRVTAEGKAAHAGSSHKKGANAIIELGQVVQEIADLTDYKRHLTFNVGTITGGTVTNRVPHFAEATGEMRTFSPKVYDEALERLLALNNTSRVSTANGDYECQVQVEITRKTPPWPHNEPTEHLFKVWQAAGEALKVRVLPEERGGLSDGNHFWHTIPTIDGLGPAGGNAHCSEQSADGSKEQEYVTVSSFVPKALLNTVALLKLTKEA